MIPIAALTLPFQGLLVGPDPFPAEWLDPGPGKLLWIQSPNCDRRTDVRDVSIVVIHATVSSTLESTTQWFYSPESRVSAHFTIGKDGSIIQHVSTFDRAWHAGVSDDGNGRTGVNAFSIGIELVNLNDGVDPYPTSQTSVLKSLLVALQQRFPITTIASHEFVARPPGRKSDPKNFPWSRLRDLGLVIKAGYPLVEAPDQDR